MLGKAFYQWIFFLIRFIRAILSQDIEKMEKLGIWECDDEDFALCSFACPVRSMLEKL